MTDLKTRSSKGALTAHGFPVILVILGLFVGYFVFRKDVGTRVGEPVVSQEIAPALRCIAVGPDDQVYVGGDFGVRLLDSELSAVQEFPTEMTVHALAVDASGFFYVGFVERVQKWSPEGEEILSWGRGGCDGAPFIRVTGIAVEGDNVFVADAGSKTVSRFTNEGTFLNEFDGKQEDVNPLGFVIPSPHFDCWAFDGVLYVTNPGLFRVEKYDFQGNLLGYCWQGGTEQREFPGCCNPTNLAVLPDGAVVVSQKGDPCVKIFHNDGTREVIISKQELSPRTQGIDLAFDSQGNIFAVDPVGDCVRVYEAETSAGSQS